jgi:hypothetical protein
MKTEIEKLKKRLEWFELFANCVQGNHRVYSNACEYADEATGVIQYPYAEGDNYWTIKEINGEYEDTNGLYQRGIMAIQSCWDDQSKEIYVENPDYLDDDERYFDTIHDVLNHARYDYDFIKISCFNSEMSDIKTGDYLVCDNPDSGKFKKSY